MENSILVTGGSGFIGSNLVDLLISKGFSVFVIDDLSTGLKNNHNDAATYIYKDITDFTEFPDQLEEIIKKNNIDTVYHLAASADVYLSINSPEKVYYINLIASIAIANICLKLNIKKFIFASTSAVYGEPEYLPVDEQHSTLPISPYGLTKLAFEQYLNYHSSISQTDYIIFRLPNVYGPRQRPDLEGGVIAIFENLIKDNKVINFYGDGSQTRDWVHVSDIIDAFYLAKDYRKDFEIFSLGSGIQTTLYDLYQYFIEITNYQRKPKYLEERPGDIKHMVMSNTKVKHSLKWQPKVILKKGLSNLVIK